MKHIQLCMLKEGKGLRRQACIWISES